jgi:hypothetical protein
MKRFLFKKDRNTDHLILNGAEKLSKQVLRFIQKNEN